MRMIRRTRFALESLESKSMLSGFASIPQPMIPAIVSMQGQQIRKADHLIRLKGNLSGTYTSDPTVAAHDEGITYSLSGNGSIGKTQSASVTGQIRGLGFVAHGRAGGSLVLSTAKGTLTLALVGPVQPGFSPLPDRFTFKITDGTGGYQGARGRGTVFLKLTPTGSGPDAGSGSFSLVLVARQAHSR